MGLFDKRKKRKLYERKIYLLQVNLENNYRSEVIQMSKEIYGELKKDFDGEEVDMEMYTSILREINNYVKKADDRYYPIEENLK